MTPIVTPTSADTSAAKTQTAAVKRDLIRAREARRQRGRNQTDGRGRRQHAAGAAHEAEDQALDEQLPDQPPPARAKRGSHGQLPLPACVANQLQAHQIGHSDEQHARYRGKEHPEDALAVAHDFIEEQPGVHWVIGAAVRLQRDAAERQSPR